MSIVRVGLAETKNFSDGYDLIFGKKKDEAKQEEISQQEQAKKDKAEKDKKDK